MPNSPRLGYSELVEGQDAPETTVNLIDRYLEQMGNRAIVLDKDLATPPGSPADGDAYIVASSPTGAWTGWANRIAFYAAGWYSITPIEGTEAYIQDENAEYKYDGSAWAASATSFAAASDVWAGTSSALAVTPDALQDAAVPTALTSSASITPDFGSGLNFTLTIAHNATLENPSNAQVGDSGIIEITQDGTGSRTLAYGTNWKFPGGAPVLSTAAGSVDCLAYFVVASGRILANLTKAYSS